MKCSKCGEECKENQAFCLKCGNPIQVVPDFNLIEAELASNIGELMEEMQHTDGSGEEEAQETEAADTAADDIKEVEYNDMELKLVDISRHTGDSELDGRTKVIGDISHMIKEEADMPEREGQPETTHGQDELRHDENKKNDKKNRKKTAIIISVIAAVLIVAVIAFVLIANSVEKSATSYDEYYKSAKAAYEKSDASKALDDAQDALDKATNGGEKKKARELLYNIYVLAEDMGEAYAENLEQLIKLGTKDSKYYVALAEYYDKNEKYTNITDLIRSVEDEAILEALSEYVVKEPEADMKPGDYKEYMAVTLTAADGCTIYYTTDSRNPSNYGDKYSEPVQITAEGENVIKAVAVNEKGVESRIAVFTYNVKLSGSNAPKVSPSGGAYSEYTKIKIEVPEGGKAYYTWDGSEPTDQSEEYTEEIDMKRGINVLKAVVIDKYGIASEVTQESYNLQIERTVSLNEAVELVRAKTGDAAGEGETVSAEYEDIVVIGNDEYYIIIAAVKDADGKDKSAVIYAVNTYDKSIEKAIDEDGEYKLEKDMETDKKTDTKDE